MLSRNKLKFLGDLIDVYDNYKMFEFDERFVDFKSSKSFFLEGKSKIEIDICYRNYIFHHYGTYFNLFEKYFSKNDINCFFQNSSSMKNENEDDLLYLYGLYKITKDEIDNLESSKDNLVSLKNELSKLKLYYLITFQNFKDLQFLVFVKQVNRRKHIDPNLILMYYRKISRNI